MVMVQDRVLSQRTRYQTTYTGLSRVSHPLSAAADPLMFAALRSIGFLEVLSSGFARSSVTRLVSTPVYAALLRNLVKNVALAPRK